MTLGDTAPSAPPESPRPPARAGWPPYRRAAPRGPPVSLPRVEEAGQLAFHVLGGDEEKLVARLQRVLRLRDEDPALTQDRDERGVGRPRDGTYLLACQRRVGGHRQLNEAGLTVPEGHQLDQVTDADRLLHQRGQQPGGGDGHVDPPRLVVQPLVARVIDPRDDPGHP